MTRTNPDTSKWDRRFMDLAELVASWSKDPSTKVGCVIVNDLRQVISLGYNGFPRGVDDDLRRYENRENKYLMVQHAEANAMHNAIQSPRGCTAYVTAHPCSQCAGALIQCGVKRVVCPDPSGGFSERFATSIAAATFMFGESGIEVVLMHDDQ